MVRDNFSIIASISNLIGDRGNFLTNQKTRYVPFSGGRDENCIAIDVDAKVADIPCTSKFCTMCSLTKQSKTLKLRGSCLEENLDTDYQFHNEIGMNLALPSLSLK